MRFSLTLISKPNGRSDMLPLTFVLISGLSIPISLITVCLTLLRRGHIRTTQPAVVFSRNDAPRDDGEPAPPKVYLRALLFSSGKRGCIVENMYTKITRNEIVQDFSVWVDGEQKLVRGSGFSSGGPVSHSAIILDAERRKRVLVLIRSLLA